MDVRKSFNSSIIVITLMAFVGVFWSGCQQNSDETKDNTIQMVYANWSEGVAMTHLAAELLESELGYEVSTKMTDIESVFRELSNSDSDVFVDAWLPQTHGGYMNTYGSNLEDLGINVEQVKTGLLVPEYVGISSINELDSEFDTIIGISSGAGIMNATQNAIEAYTLQTNLQEGSEELMTNQLIDAVKRQDPIVVTGWTPHWIYNRFNLKFLEDPQNVYGDSEKIHTIARENFTSEHSRASLFFERFSLTESQLGALMDEIQTFPDNERRAVQNWIEDNEFVVNRWIRGLEPERETVM